MGSVILPISGTSAHLSIRAAPAAPAPDFWPKRVADELKSGQPATLRDLATAAPEFGEAIFEARIVSFLDIVEAVAHAGGLMFNVVQQRKTETPEELHAQLLALAEELQQAVRRS